MAKKDKRFDRRKAERANCDVGPNCSISDLTDSVEFADEPFDLDINDKKRKNTNRTKRGGGGC